jgi:hypothetical protein
VKNNIKLKERKKCTKRRYRKGVSGRRGIGAGVYDGETEMQKLLISFMPSPHICKLQQ